MFLRRLHVTGNVRNHSRLQFNVISKQFLISGSTIQLFQSANFLAIHTKFMVESLPDLKKSLFSVKSLHPVALFCVCDCCHLKSKECESRAKNLQWSRSVPK